MHALLVQYKLLSHVPHLYLSSHGLLSSKAVRYANTRETKTVTTSRPARHAPAPNIHQGTQAFNASKQGPIPADSARNEECLIFTYLPPRLYHSQLTQTHYHRYLGPTKTHWVKWPKNLTSSTLLDRPRYKRSHGMFTLPSTMDTQFMPQPRMTTQQQPLHTKTARPPPSGTYTQPDQRTPDSRTQNTTESQLVTPSLKTGCPAPLKRPSC